LLVCFFFFQAEDGIRDRNVTGVQTCALPICRRWLPKWRGTWCMYFPSCWRTPLRTPRMIPRCPCAAGSTMTDRGSSRSPTGVPRSEERRVGKEGREGGGGWDRQKKKKEWRKR